MVSSPKGLDIFVVSYAKVFICSVQSTGYMNTYSYVIHMNVCSCIHIFIYSISQFYHKLEIQPKVVDFTTNNQRLYFWLDTTSDIECGSLASPVIWTVSPLKTPA